MIVKECGGALTFERTISTFIHLLRLLTLTSVRRGVASLQSSSRKLLLIQVTEKLTQFTSSIHTPPFSSCSPLSLMTFDTGVKSLESLG